MELESVILLQLCPSQIGCVAVMYPLSKFHTKNRFTYSPYERYTSIDDVASQEGISRNTVVGLEVN